MSDELIYIKQSFAEMHGLKMSVTYLGNDAVGASNASQTIFMIGNNDEKPTFSFKSLCTRDRISELHARISCFPDTEIVLNQHPNQEVMSLDIKSRKGKIKSVFGCMKESVIYGREKTLEDIAMGGSAARERPPKRINTTNQFEISVPTTEELDDIKRLASALKSKYISVTFDKVMKYSLLSERNETAEITSESLVTPLTNQTLFHFRYLVDDFLLIVKAYPTISKIYVCSNGAWLFPTSLFNVYMAPIKNIT